MPQHLPILPNEIYSRLMSLLNVFSGEGTIACALWHPSLPILSWTNDKGVKVLETETSQRISFIPNPSESIFDSLDPNIVWINNELLLISWKTIIKVLSLLPDIVLHLSYVSLDRSIA